MILKCNLGKCKRRRGIDRTGLGEGVLVGFCMYVESSLAVKKQGVSWAAEQMSGKTGKVRRT